PGALLPAGVEVVRGDIRDPRVVEHAIAGCPLVFHLAARTSHGNLPARDIYSINVEGTENVVRAAAQAGVARLVFASTARVYGIIRNHAVREDTPINPDSAYPSSKARGEQIVLSHHARAGLPAVIARITSVFGPGSRSWLGLFQAIAARRFRLIGSGGNYHHPGDVSDIVEGLLLCGRAEGIEGQTYIITGNEAMPLCDMIRMIQDEVGAKDLPRPLPALPLLLYWRLNDVLRLCGYDRLPRFDRVEFFLNDRIFDQTRARHELGYEPKVSLKEAIRRTADWYRSQGHLNPAPQSSA
ncbi:MAG TPA: NAD-dependent epimerase/dehydratase family protein, partial [Candidatus Eisenbacteria bacterium]|nr:NAD-dependent epimerase/dehydratase family protein [Candidatus Eisenbacteria bacterium]